MKKLIIGFALISTCFLAQATTIFSIAETSTEITSSWSGPTADPNDPFGFQFYWGVTPTASTICNSGTSCDTTPGGLNATGRLNYIPKASSGPMGWDGRALVSLYNIYEPDGITLSDTLEISRVQVNRGAAPGYRQYYYGISVQEIFHSADQGTLAAYTTASTPYTEFLRVGGSLFDIEIVSVIETGSLQSVPLSYELGLKSGMVSNFQSFAASVPEPISMALMGIGLIGLSFLRFKRGKTNESRIPR